MTSFAKILNKEKDLIIKILLYIELKYDSLQLQPGISNPKSWDKGRERENLLLVTSYQNNQIFNK